MAREFKTERGAQQQRLIHGALIGLMLERPYAEITVSAICSRAGMPRRTFYYYYESKQEVLGGILEELVRESDLESMFPREGQREGIEASFARFFRYWRDRRPTELAAIIGNDLGQMLVNRSMEWLREDPQWSRVMKLGNEDRQTISAMVGMTCVFYTLFYWQNRGFRQTPEQVAQYVTGLLTRPLYPAEKQDQN